MTIYTIGHSIRGLDEFLALLREHGIECVVDVRSIPRSGRYPHFNGGALAPALAGAGIVYRHMPGLGGRRGRRKGAPSRNTFWREEGFRNFADYAEGPDFARAFAELRALAYKRRTAIMCAEAVWWRCHRRIIADYLVAAGEEVRHILGPGKVETAVLTPEARVLPGGALRYAAPNLLDGVAVDGG
ncbi:MAG: DUF488 domain-containing protein [Alphaproteobacteria bacterium]|nr:DUF488 domain-containing protein [Alphaproteobacteria bacterium]